MAKRMALVPESWLRQTHTEPGPTPPKQSLTILEPEPKQSLIEMAELLPKSYRSRARMLLHYLEGHIKLNEQQRVIYPPNNQLGSHIIDLVKYFVSKFPTDRPLDAPKFEKLLAKAGVPNSAVAKKAEPMTKWRHL